MGQSTATVFLIAVAVILSLVGGASAQAPARVWQGTIEIPTYLLGDEDPNPPFPLIARHNVYPYTMLDDLTDQRAPRTYNAVFLENEYLKAIVLPEMDGRLYSLYDKVSRREVFYRNHVVKYGLVALRGAWISGGVEFNFPDGHTVNTVSPVAYQLRESPDGSAGVIVGNTDWITRMHWEVTLTLHPGEARIEQQVKLFNPTATTNLYWYWANAAVPATADMEFIYPMREAYPHQRWTVSYPVYQGVDLSWYRNVRQPTSLFGKQVHRDFFGAYYHDNDYGVAHVADFRQVPGKKTWTWGVAGDGLIWTHLLTDSDGAYNEIQSGRYETQMDYEFMPPRRVESWTEYWYPVRGLGNGFVAAEPEVAINLRAGNNGEAELAIVPLRSRAARVRVQLGARVVHDASVTVRPLQPVYVPLAEVAFEDGRKHLTVDVLDENGGDLLHWNAADPVDGNPNLIPTAGKPPAPALAPQAMTVEQLYLRGIAQEKSGDALAAVETFEQVLQRDPEYIPALLKLAYARYRAADFTGAREYIARALARNHTAPEVNYAAGVIERGGGTAAFTCDGSSRTAGSPAAGRRLAALDARTCSRRLRAATEGADAKAADYFWDAIRFAGPEAATLAQLGELAMRERDYPRAIELLRQSLDHNGHDARALADLAAALRLSGDAAAATVTAARAVSEMPLLPFAIAETDQDGISRAQAGGPGQFKIHNVDNYIETAVWYRSLGDIAAADRLLQNALRELAPEAISPLVYYYLASDARQRGDAATAQSYAQQGAKARYQKVFPARVEDALVLFETVAADPTDAHAQYLLGTFLFARGRYDEANHSWTAARALGFDDPVLERDLGVYAWKIRKDLNQASTNYLRAIQLNPNDYRLYLDLDTIDQQRNDLAAESDLLAHAPAAVRDRDVIRAREALLLVRQQQYDRALAVLASHNFRPWEGGVTVHQVYVLANLEQGRRALRARNYAAAIAAFQRAREYPENLGVGKPDRPHDEEALYWLGEALDASGDHNGARAAWQAAAAQLTSSEQPSLSERATGTPELYGAMALARLGQNERANAVLDRLSAAAEDGSARAEDFYLAGVVESFRRRYPQARSDFERALAKDPAFWQARFELRQFS